jgi:splicing factor 3A subunit 3
LEEENADIKDDRESNDDNEDDDNDDDDDDNDKDEGPLYNPLNLPLGWDGKPIPYWLYKLHGLGVE